LLKILNLWDIEQDPHPPVPKRMPKLFFFAPLRLCVKITITITAVRRFERLQNHPRRLKHVRPNTNSLAASKAHVPQPT
jgi:hypothetical protein